MLAYFLSTWPTFASGPAGSEVTARAQDLTMTARARRTDGETRGGVVSAGLLAALTAPIHLFLPLAVSELLAALVISGIAGIYVGFAISDGRRTVIALQSCVCLAFIGAAAAASLYAPLAIPALYVLHGLWDAAHHRTSLPMPGWYVPFCLVYDVLAALVLWAIWLL
jgi:hypothetical protein